MVFVLFFQRTNCDDKYDGVRNQFIYMKLPLALGRQITHISQSYFASTCINL